MPLTRGQFLGVLGGSLFGLPAPSSAEDRHSAGPTDPSAFLPPSYAVLDGHIAPGSREVVLKVRRDRPTAYSLAMRFAVSVPGGPPPSPQQGEFVFDYDVEEIK